MPTTYKKIRNPVKLMEHIKLPPEEKAKLPAPELLSGVYVDDKDICIDIRDHEGNCWTLAGRTVHKFRSSIKYFRALDRELIKHVVPKSLPMYFWRKTAGVACVGCGSDAKRNPAVVEYGCPKCGTNGPIGELFVLKPTLKQPKKEQPPEPVAVAPPVQEPPPKLEGMSLRDRLAARRASK